MSSLKPKIWLSSPHMGGNEMNYIREAFDTNWIAPLGPNVDAFERSLAEYCGKKHCAALNSGTSAIHLALIMLGVGPGDYVICQSFSFSATANPVKYLGATPVFIDSEPGTWNMDPWLLEEAILDIKEGCNGFASLDHNVGNDYPLRQEYKVMKIQANLSGSDLKSSLINKNRRTEFFPCKKIKAIIPVHLYGMPAKMNEILALGRKYDIPVIEDAAEALGSSYCNRPAGSMGLMGILSFNGNKIITTSGGGALLSDSSELVNQARFLSTQARDSAPHYQHSQVGYNYRMSNVIAGIGRGQLEVLDERVEKRRENNLFYRDCLSNIPGITFQTEPAAGFFSNYWLTALTIDPEKTGGITREDLRLAMERENIEARPLWKPLHLQPVFEGSPSFVNGTAEKLFNQGLCLPSGSNLSTDDLYSVVETLLTTLTAPVKTKTHYKTVPVHR